jgi:hypothetical protein
MRNYLLIAICLLAGCSRDGLVPVKGRVLLDGQPVEKAAVLFEPDGGGVPATGVTDANGDFTRSTSGRGAGAAAGLNKISVAKQVPVQPNRKVEEGEIVPMRSETPDIYASPRTSGLSVDVKRGMAPVELQLKSGK